MPSEHLSAEDRGELDRLLDTIDFDNALKTLETIRDRAECRTELVSDSDGVLHVRKTVPHDPAGLARGLALQTVDSPHLAHVERCYELDGSDITVLEYVPGKTLRAHVEKEGAFDARTALALFADMADGARALHEARPCALVHRDINPNNIIVKKDDDGTLHACLIDYSIARMVRDDAETDTRHLGTARYAAPEQYGFKQTDARSDFFALGLVLTFMLTGSDPAFDTDGMPVGIDGLPEMVRGIVQRCTAFDPANRYPNDASLLADTLPHLVGAPAATLQQTGASIATPQQAVTPLGATTYPTTAQYPDATTMTAQRIVELNEAAQVKTYPGTTAQRPVAPFATVPRATEAQPKPFLWQRIKQATAQGRGQTLWNVWRVALTVALAIILAMFVYVIIDPSHSGGNTSLDNFVVACLMTAFLFMPVYTLATDFRGFWERYLYVAPLLRTILILVISFLVFLLSVGSIGLVLKSMGL